MEPLAPRLRPFIFDWPDYGPVESFVPFSNAPYSLFLDSNRASHPLSRYSYVLMDPFETITSKDGLLVVTNAENRYEYKGDAFRAIRERLALYAPRFAPLNRKGFPPFQGGACGFFGYDLGRGLEKIPNHAAPNTEPDMAIGFYNQWIAFDIQSKKAWYVIYAADADDAAARKSDIEQYIKNHKAAPAVPFTPAWTSKRSEDDLENSIRRTIDYIEAGDIFQANITRRFSTKTPENLDPFAHYITLRRINPAPYAAFMRFDDIVLSSCSPERFLSAAGNRIETRPIKGTMADDVPATRLQLSEKDRAENIMIVDLMRNDLSKVCNDHSVIVDSLCNIETFEGLHHMVSTISGTLKADQTAIDALCACFPGGSITGAPKIRAMEIIDELEPDRRGAYCGGIGWMGFDGAMDTAITIRTLVYTDGMVHLQTGGGITVKSNPNEEVQESLTKAQKIFESFECIEQIKDKVSA